MSQEDHARIKIFAAEFKSVKKASVGLVRLREKEKNAEALGWLVLSVMVYKTVPVLESRTTRCMR